MQIIIPMTGMGVRFSKAGYTDSKPLILVDGKPIIEHVINLFPGETNFIFICNSIHLRKTRIRNVLEQIMPTGRIVEIAPHKKGPVFAVTQAFNLINEEEEVIVNYCDFGKYWDYLNFLKHTRERNADGAVSAYKGFHPHMLGSTNYAFIRSDRQWMQEIREKQPFTENRMQEYASDGTYYFKKGLYVKKYFTELIKRDVNLKGEYYVSVIYNLMLKDNLNISIYEIQHMLQWGEPRDLEEYLRWSQYFKNIVKPYNNILPAPKSIVLIPLAGKGQRFITDGYQQPKPLIQVSGKPMIIQAANYLPTAERHIFVCLSDHIKQYPLKDAIRAVYPISKIISLNKITEGQACTCELGVEQENMESSLLIGACDNGMLWNKEKYQNLLDDENVDAIVWSFRNHTSSEQNPRMYGWLKVDKQDNITEVSVKVPISDDPYNDHAIIGTFYFRKVKYFLESLKRLYRKNTRINNEFYVDSCINELLEMNLNVKVFEVDNYICWGTPDDLRTYEYWQSFFHKCERFPYSLDKDVTVNKDGIKELERRYTRFEQEYK